MMKIAVLQWRAEPSQVDAMPSQQPVSLAARSQCPKGSKLARMRNLGWLKQEEWMVDWQRNKDN